MNGEAYKRSTKNQKNQHGKATKKPVSIPNGAELNSYLKKTLLHVVF